MRMRDDPRSDYCTFVHATYPVIIQELRQEICTPDLRLDSRSLPNAQPVGEVATAIAALIEHPRAELYTRPELAQLTARL